MRAGVVIELSPVCLYEAQRSDATGTLSVGHSVSSASHPRNCCGVSPKRDRRVATPRLQLSCFSLPLIIAQSSFSFWLDFPPGAGRNPIQSRWFHPATRRKHSNPSLRAGIGR